MDFHQKGDQLRPDQRSGAWANLPMLLAYVAELELEVDRLRQHGHLVHQEMLQGLHHLQQTCSGSETESVSTELEGVGQEIRQLQVSLSELRDLPGYHPAHDQVLAIALRPLIEQIFRWQQRLQRTQNVSLRLELECDYVEWFPARLRHLLDNLISNALKYRDPEKAEAWITVGLRASSEAYEFRVMDNGAGMESKECTQLLELFFRSAPTRLAGVGVGLAVVKVLVEQSNGTLTVESKPGVGTTFLVTLPRYAVNDFLL